MPQRILVVDDDCETVRLVRAYLEESHYEVLIACDGETALHMLRCERPDLVLLDLMQPQHDGWAASLAALPIVMLTSRVEGHDRRVAPQLHNVDLELGTDDDMAESFNPREVVAGVRAVLRHAQGSSIPPKVIQIGEVTIDLDARRVEIGGQLVHLTPTELGLLRALAEQPGQTLTRQEMIEKGLGYGYEGLGRTVDSHIKNLRHKLDAAGEAAHLVETVFGVGYRLAAGDHT